ncbi:hypothetical protein GCM10007979_18480 [Nocardioides albus]|nr:hypothetical protein GCM10007979_18480 [Nocardioides albus]
MYQPICRVLLGAVRAEIRGNSVRALAPPPWGRQAVSGPQRGLGTRGMPNPRAGLGMRDHRGAHGPGGAVRG